MMPWDLQWTLVSWTTVSASSSPLYKHDFMSLLTLNSVFMSLLTLKSVFMSLLTLNSVFMSLLTLNSVFMLDVKLYFNFNCS